MIALCPVPEGLSGTLQQRCSIPRAYTRFWSACPRDTGKGLSECSDHIRCVIVAVGNLLVPSSPCERCIFQTDGFWSLRVATTRRGLGGISLTTLPRSGDRASKSPSYSERLGIAIRVRSSSDLTYRVYPASSSIRELHKTLTQGMMSVLFVLPTKELFSETLTRLTYSGHTTEGVIVNACDFFIEGSASVITSCPALPPE
jgi:hypothetical protein